MSLTLYYHPLASFCHKVLIALYEKDIPFSPWVVDLMDAAASAPFFDLWPVGKIPVLRDAAEDRTIPETTIITEYLEQKFPAPPLFPAAAADRLDARLWDRFFDLYVQVPMQAVVGDRIRPDGARDPYGVAEARRTLNVGYDMIERQIAGKRWIVGDAFSVADCAAAPALFYAGIVAPFAETHPGVAGYFERLLARPSFARVLAEARPYFHMFPFKEEMPARFLTASAAG